MASHRADFACLTIDGTHDVEHLDTILQDSGVSLNAQMIGEYLPRTRHSDGWYFVLFCNAGNSRKQLRDSYVTITNVPTGCHWFDKIIHFPAFFRTSCLKPESLGELYEFTRL